MPNTEPAMDKREIVESIIKKSKETLVEVYPIAAATKGREGKELSEMAELVEAGAVAFSDDGCAIATAELTRRAMEYANMLGVPIIEHAEEATLDDGGAMNEGMFSTKLGLPGMPTVAEDIIVARDILLAEYTGARVHIAHLSSAHSLELIRWAKQRGIQVTCEVTPHHFTLTDESVAVSHYDTNTKMNPPLRSPRDVEAMIAGMQDGTIDVIATDHAPHAIEEKDAEFAAAPFGIIGLETALGLIITRLVKTNVLPLADAIAKVTVAPRRILNLPPVQIKEGQPANLVFFSQTKTWRVDKTTSHSKSRNTPFHGWDLTGRVFAVYNKQQWWRNPDF
jgi:dihydroorotase